MQFSTVLLLFFCIIIGSARAAKEQDPLLHLATENQIIIRNPDGGYKMAYRHHDGFRAELRSPDGVVKGVYNQPDTGEPVPYISDKNGYRTTDLSSLGLTLPPLPYYLHPRAGNKKFPQAHEIDNTDETLSEQEDNNKDKILYFPFGKLDNDLEAIVIDPAKEPFVRFHQPANRLVEIDYLDGEEIEGVLEVDEDPIVTVDVEDSEDNVSPFGALAGIVPTLMETSPEVEEVAEITTELPIKPQEPSETGQIGGSINIPGGIFGFYPAGGSFLPVTLQPGQPFAHINPSATAISGDSGAAQASPIGSAVVGAGGISVARPSATAWVAGSSGTAVSRPVSLAQAGPGGIAIAAGQAVAVAGLGAGHFFPVQGYQPVQGIVAGQQSGALQGSNLGQGSAAGQGLPPAPTGDNEPQWLGHGQNPGQADEEPGFVAVRAGQQISRSGGHVTRSGIIPSQTNIYPYVANYYFNFLPHAAATISAQRNQ